MFQFTVPHDVDTSLLSAVDSLDPRLLLELQYNVLLLPSELPGPGQYHVALRQAGNVAAAYANESAAGAADRAAAYEDDGGDLDLSDLEGVAFGVDEELVAPW